MAFFENKGWTLFFLNLKFWDFYIFLARKFIKLFFINKNFNKISSNPTWYYLNYMCLYAFLNLLYLGKERKIFNVPFVWYLFAPFGCCCCRRLMRSHINRFPPFTLNLFLCSFLLPWKKKISQASHGVELNDGERNKFWNWKKCQHDIDNKFHEFLSFSFAHR